MIGSSGSRRVAALVLAVVLAAAGPAAAGAGPSGVAGFGVLRGWIAGIGDWLGGFQQPRSTVARSEEGGGADPNGSAAPAQMDPGTGDHPAAVLPTSQGDQGAEADPNG